jgi:cell division septation protein DedD
MGPRLYPDESDPQSPPPPGGGWSVDPEDRPFYGEAPPRRGFTAFLRPVVYGVFALACAGALWFAYNKGRDVGSPGNGDVRLIRADQGATKVKPTDAGGTNVPDQDKLVYNPSQPGAKVERLLPPPEQPLARPVPPPPDPSAPLPVETIGPTTAPKAAPASPPGQEIKPVTNSGTLGSLPTSALPPAPPPSATPAPTPAAKPVALAPPKPTAAAAAPAASGGSFRVQIAATRDEPTAKSEFERLKKAHEDLLGGMSATVVKADLGDKGIFYRVQAGPVADHDKAEKLCSELKKFAIACIIVKP